MECNDRKIVNKNKELQNQVKKSQKQKCSNRKKIIERSI